MSPCQRGTVGPSVARRTLDANLRETNHECIFLDGQASAPASVSRAKDIEGLDGLEVSAANAVTWPSMDVTQKRFPSAMPS